ncbi:MAG TPA: VapE family protein [Candidatus Competibacteraceae bacterium]|nr:VapE family protein [Candidatus Competibacteraceae bacterium]HRZ05090.1 VapE family protein [Candidatus Competibacteraceae bacterium]HSA48116.1 VapE family protein [Candidatus Competibacteraceae bacterium]
MTTLQDAIHRLQSMGLRPVQTGDQWLAYCPIHEADGQGHKPSLTLKAGDTADVVVCCHAGCDRPAILKALGVNGTPRLDKPRILATYAYRDTSGATVFEKVRYEPKDFRIRHRPEPGADWVWKKPQRDAYPLYRLPELRTAIEAGETVWIVEGEKDADRLAVLGFVATCNFEGAAKGDQRQKWRPEYTEQLSGAARVILLPDNDAPGKAHMRHVAQQLHGKVADLRWLELPGLPDKGDVSDWLNAGHTVDELRALVEQAGAPLKESALPEDPPTAAVSKKPRKTLATLVDLLSAPPWTGVMGFNEFRQRIEKRLTTPYKAPPGPWIDSDTAETMLALERATGVAFGRDMVDLATLAIAHRNSFNPAKEQLLALAERWDRQPRLRSWLVDYLNAKASDGNGDYLAEIGEKWLKGVAARVLIPGCKRDDVLVLRSPQGWRKSTAAQCIADAIHPDAFTDSVDLGNLAEAKIQIRGIVIAELGELAGMAKAEVESIKAFVSARSDHFREKFGRYAQDFPRTVSFIGSTNDQTFLKDPTGNRRWWPVTLEAPIDIPRLEAILPQLIGEAAQGVIQGHAWHVTAEKALEQAERVREAHFEEDVWTDAALAIVDSLESNGEPVTIPAILDALNIPRMQQSPYAKQRVAGILKVNGYEEARKWLDRKANRYLRFWRKLPNAPDPMVTVVTTVTSRQTGAKTCNQWGTSEINPMVTPSPDSGERVTVVTTGLLPDGYGESLGKQGMEPVEPVEPLDFAYRVNFSEEKNALPLAQTILATLNGTPMLREDLERAVGLAHGKAGPALIKDTIDRLLLSGAMGKINGRLIVQEVRS